MHGRLARLRSEMAAQALDAMLVVKPENRAYLSGFTGSAGALVITATNAHLATDFRYLEQAAAQAPHFQVERLGRGAGAMAQSIAKLLPGAGQRIGFEGDTVSVEEFRSYQEALGEAEWVSIPGLVDRLRTVKEETEIASIRRAAAIADAAFNHVLAWIQPGMQEREVALELEFFARKSGAASLAFDTIVASGSRSSLPHGLASDRTLGYQEFITIDFGCMVDGYCSDMTRTVMLGEPDEKQRAVYDTVLAAQTRGLAAAAPGISGRDLDAVCRDWIAAQGYGEFFDHSTGHGVGRQIHEEPRIAATGTEVLQPGHVITVEPGIYIPGWGGVRIEDLVLITRAGCEALSQSPKALIILE